MTVFWLLITLIVISAASELFTNAIEHLGKRFGFSEGATGSLFAAIGTALPETMVPILSIINSTQEKLINDELSTGAILGAPLMLSTLSICIMAIIALSKRGLLECIKPERTVLKRDLDFFLFAFSISTFSILIKDAFLGMRATLSIILFTIYILYIATIINDSNKIKQGSNSNASINILLLSRFRLPPNNLILIIQLLIALILLIIGTEGFVKKLRDISIYSGISPLLLSLLIVPIATELPEKVNSILWILRGKDTLAFCNITGAMVFQGTLLPAIGIIFTDWKSCFETLVGTSITLIAAFWLRINANRQQGIPFWVLILNGTFYIGYLLLVFKR